jgi:hypothetical protein
MRMIVATWPGGKMGDHHSVPLLSAMCIEIGFAEEIPSAGLAGVEGTIWQGGVLNLDRLRRVRLRYRRIIRGRWPRVCVVMSPVRAESLWTGETQVARPASIQGGGGSALTRLRLAPPSGRPLLSDRGELGGSIVTGETCRYTVHDGRSVRIDEGGRDQFERREQRAQLALIAELQGDDEAVRGWLDA